MLRELAHDWRQLGAKASPDWEVRAGQVARRDAFMCPEINRRCAYVVVTFGWVGTEQMPEEGSVNSSELLTPADVARITRIPLAAQANGAFEIATDSAGWL